MSKYLELLQKRAADDDRPVEKAPLALVPSVFTDLRAARDAVAEATRQQTVSESRSRKLADRPSRDAVEAAEEALAAAEDAALDVTVWLALKGRTSAEVIAVSKQVEDLAKAEGRDVDQGEYNRALIVDALMWVEDRHGNRIDDIGKDEIGQVLSSASSGELATLTHTIHVASLAPDFPTLPRS